MNYFLNYVDFSVDSIKFWCLGLYLNTGTHTSKVSKGLGGSMSQVVGLPNNSYKPITNTAWVHAWLCKLQKGYTRLAAASDTVYQLLAHGRWFSPGTSASSTIKTGRHDMAESDDKHNKSINLSMVNNWSSHFLVYHACTLHIDHYLISIVHWLTYKFNITVVKHS